MRPTATRRGAASKALLLAASIGLLLLTSGCVRDPISPKGNVVYELFYVILWLALPVFVFVEGMLIISIVRFRRRKGDDSEPRQNHGSRGALVTFFAAPLAIVLVLLFFGESAVAQVDEIDPNPVEKIVVTGFQWEWSAKYLNENFIVTGKTTESAMEMALPINKSVQIELRSNDVIHEFYVPDLLFMKNAVPGHPNVFTFTPTVMGTFHGQCAQFCGLWHSKMTFDVKVMSDADFQSWVAEQKKPKPIDISKCPAPATSATLVAEKVSWDKNCIAVPAGQPFQITIDNRDVGIAHNFAIYISSDLKQRLYLSPDNTGPGTTTFTVPAMPAGTYYFQCDIHGPAMPGALVVR